MTHHASATGEVDALLGDLQAAFSFISKRLGGGHRAIMNIHGERGRLHFHWTRQFATVDNSPLSINWWPNNQSYASAIRPHNLGFNLAECKGQEGGQHFGRMAIQHYINGDGKHVFGDVNKIDYSDFIYEDARELVAYNRADPQSVEPPPPV